MTKKIIFIPKMVREMTLAVNDSTIVKEKLRIALMNNSEMMKKMGKENY
jgi:hypothetical protein